MILRGVSVLGCKSSDDPRAHDEDISGLSAGSQPRAPRTLFRIYLGHGSMTDFVLLRISMSITFLSGVTVTVTVAQLVTGSNKSVLS